MGSRGETENEVRWARLRTEDEVVAGDVAQLVECLLTIVQGTDC